MNLEREEALGGEFFGFIVEVDPLCSVEPDLDPFAFAEDSDFVPVAPLKNLVSLAGECRLRLGFTLLGL